MQPGDASLSRLGPANGFAGLNSFGLRGICVWFRLIGSQVVAVMLSARVRHAVRNAQHADI